jgi:hypothetical protein
MVDGSGIQDKANLARLPSFPQCISPNQATKIDGVPRLLADGSTGSKNPSFRGKQEMSLAGIEPARPFLANGF